MSGATTSRRFLTMTGDTMMRTIASIRARQARVALRAALLPAAMMLATLGGCTSFSVSPEGVDAARDLALREIAVANSLGIDPAQLSAERAQAYRDQCALFVMVGVFFWPDTPTEVVGFCDALEDALRPAG